MNTDFSREIETFVKQCTLESDTKLNIMLSFILQLRHVHTNLKLCGHPRQQLTYALTKMKLGSSR